MTELYQYMLPEKRCTECGGGGRIVLRGTIVNTAWCRTCDGSGSILLSPKEIITMYHYTRSWPSGKSVTLTYEDAIVVISIPANYNVSRWLGCRTWELTRLWAPDGHRKNLLTETIAYAVDEFKKLNVADALISYADPNVGHNGGVYRAASWVYLGNSEETRAYRGRQGEIISRRKFHSGRRFLRKAEILARGYTELKLPGKIRFARWLTRIGKQSILAKAAIAGCKK